MSASGDPGAIFSEFAPAKINLHLHVVGRRADGYHLLDSLVVFADIGDRLTVSPGDGLSLSVTGRFAAELDAEADNLVLRAARALAAHAGIQAAGKLVLEKNLPVASGIGGGSADAAATLRLLWRFWGLQHSATGRLLVGDDPHSVAPDTLAPGRLASASLAADPLTASVVARSLGADVPVCLAGRSALMSGIGEVLAPAPPLPDVGIVLVNPGVAVSTPAVFRARTGVFSDTARFPTIGWQDADALVAALRTAHNDLEPPARLLAPAIGDALDALADTPGCLLARMSGSGATCFGLFATRAAAKDAARANVRDGWWVWGGGLMAG